MLCTATVDYGCERNDSNGDGADSVAIFTTETRDGLQKQTTDDHVVSETPSPEMQRISRSFSRNHAMSIHLNLLTIGAMLWWGYKLASNLNLELK